MKEKSKIDSHKDGIKLLLPCCYSAGVLDPLLQVKILRHLIHKEIC